MYKTLFSLRYNEMLQLWSNTHIGWKKMQTAGEWSMFHMEYDRYYDDMEWEKKKEIPYESIGEDLNGMCVRIHGVFWPKQICNSPEWNKPTLSFQVHENIYQTTSAENEPSFISSI